jgi:hypothetical protein
LDYIDARVIDSIIRILTHIVCGHVAYFIMIMDVCICVVRIQLPCGFCIGAVCTYIEESVVAALFFPPLVFCHVDLSTRAEFSHIHTRGCGI